MIQNNNFISIGNKIYVTCPNCGMVVRINKPFIGSWHICEPKAERLANLTNNFTSFSVRYSRGRTSLFFGKVSPFGIYVAARSIGRNSTRIYGEDTYGGGK
jgi:hypothetical protein